MNKKVLRPEILLVVVAFIVFILVSCKSEESEWNKIKQKNDPLSVKKFIKDFPEGKYINDAKALFELKDIPLKIYVKLIDAHLQGTSRVASGDYNSVASVFEPPATISGEIKTIIINGITIELNDSKITNSIIVTRDFGNLLYVCKGIFPSGQPNMHIFANQFQINNIINQLKLVNTNDSTQQIGQFKDIRDGKIYKTIKIGFQVWLAENFAFKPDKGNYWIYENNQSNLSKYGYLYDWQTANKIVPEGWKLPTQNDFETLFDNVNYAGAEIYKELILKGNSGFSAAFAGLRWSNGSFEDGCTLWTSDEKEALKAFCLDFSSKNSAVSFLKAEKNMGLSVRYIKK